VPDGAIRVQTAAPTTGRIAVPVEKLGIGVAFLILLVLAYLRNVNWDEFYFLSHVHGWLDGRLDRPMQTGFVHAFGWLGSLPGHEMEQIFAARIVMVGCLAVTAASIHRIAAHVTTSRCATFAVLAFLLSGFVLPHGGSFRADPIAAALLMLALAIAVTSRLRAHEVAAIALCVALSFLVTVKSALYLPAFLGAMIWRMEDRGAVIRLALAGLLAGVLALVLYTMHASGLVPSEANRTASNARDALTTTLLRSGLFPRADAVLGWAIFSLPQIALAAIGLASTGRARTTVVLLLFLVPLLSVVVYRNAFPYFFPFATPLLAVAVALGVQRIGSGKARGQLLLAMAACAAVQLVLIAPEHARTQRATVAEVHRLFDAPVPYIDPHGMIASFPSAAFFMSTWGVSRYRAGGEPVFAGIVETRRPPLLLVHRPVLERAMMPGRETDTAVDLLPEDRAVLRASYIHYSGTIWLAGAEAVLGDGPARLALPFPGRYRVETDAPVRIDSAEALAGTVLAVDRQAVRVEGAAGTRVRLIWDTGVAPIRRDALGHDVYFGFDNLVP
jgi:hypothetical protein